MPVAIKDIKRVLVSKKNHDRFDYVLYQSEVKIGLNREKLARLLEQHIGPYKYYYPLVDAIISVEHDLLEVKDDKK